MSGGGGKRGWAADEHAARIHPNRNDAGTALVFAQRFAGNQRNAPIVERAGDGRVMDDALAQRAMFVRAFVHQGMRSEEHTSELQSLMRISYAVFCLKKKKTNTKHIK